MKAEELAKLLMENHDFEVHVLIPGDWKNDWPDYDIYAISGITGIDESERKIYLKACQ